MPEVVKDNLMVPPLSTTSDDPNWAAKMAPKEPPLSASSSDGVGEEEVLDPPEVDTLAHKATETPVEVEPEKPKKEDKTPPWVKALISKERARTERAEAEAAEARAESARLKQATAKPTISALEIAEPNENDYPDTATYKQAMRAYTKSVADNAAKAAIDEYDRQIVEGRKAAFLQQQEADRQEFLDRGRSKYDDFAEKCETDALPITPAMFEAAKDAENGEDVIYYLGSNPKEARRIASLNPIKQAKEIAKIEMKLAEPAPVTNAITATAAALKPPVKTPAPIKPVGTNNSVRKERAEMSVEEYMADRRRELYPHLYK